MRHPKIYVVIEDRGPFHDTSSTVRFATLDIDQAFVVADGIVATALKNGTVDDFDVQIYELDGTVGVARAWNTTKGDPNNDPNKLHGKWFQFIGCGHKREQYKHVPGGRLSRKERLLEAAEIIMMMAVEGDE